MASIGRKDWLPREIAASLDLERGERPLAHARGADGEWYVGTDRALYLVKPDGAGAQRLVWELIERAEWRRDSEILAIVELADWGQPETRHEVTITEPGQLLELLRERVTKSVLINVFTPVIGKRGLSVVGRRSPTGTGDVSWSYVLAEGLDPGDPLVQEVAERALAGAEAELAGL